jgi:NAD(P)-dependent dehydrogenase (short-subunit alcohol dehydrogenase family)
MTDLTATTPTPAFGPRRPAPPSRVWLVTGAGRGFGRRFTEAALAAGDRVVATARRPEVLDDLVAAHPDRLVAVPLDVTDRAAVFAAVEAGVAAFGHLDVVVNNAGFGLSGAVEEVAEADARRLFDTNFFGALWVCQAVVPHLRRRRSGHLVQMSSVSGVLGIPTMGLYAASKFALEGLSETLAEELAPFGVHVTLVEPRIYATGFLAGMAVAPPLDAYGPMRAALMERFAGRAPGDPAGVVGAVLDLVDHPCPPRRLLLGDGDYDTVIDAYRRRLVEWEDWEPVSRAAG